MPVKKYILARKESAQSKIKELKAKGEIDRNYRIYSDDSFVYIPVVDSYSGEFVYRNANEIMKKKPVSGSFDSIGSIAIVKKDDKVFARNLLDSSKTIRSVYYDAGVEGEKRIRSLKLLAGEDNTVTTYRENGCVFMVDVSKAYFSPRLGTERMKLVTEVKDGEFIIDMFSGIGTISIEIARYRNVRIVSMDINEDAVKLMDYNIKINTLKGSITTLCGDSQELVSRYKNADRVIMNNPTGSSRFIESAVASLREGGIVNYYEIATKDQMTERSESFKKYGISLRYMRKVHSYSSTAFLYSSAFIKETS